MAMDGTFKGCSSLNSVIIPNSVTTIGKETFSGCSGLVSVYIPNSVSEIGELAFSNTGLTSVVLPSLLNSIGQNAFQGCDKLTSIITRPLNPPLMANRNVFTEQIYNSATLSVPQVAMSSYKSKDWWNIFKTINDDQSLNNYYDFVSNGIYYNKVDESNVEVTFKDTNYNSYSGSVTVPATVSTGGKTYHVTGIGFNAFYNCSGMTSITLPSSITRIAAGSFNGCSGLTNLTIPLNVVAIGNNAFAGCNNITQLTWNAKRCWSNGNMVTGNITKVTIGNEVEVLPIGFVANSKITTVTIPNSVTSIGKNGFNGCSGLTSLTIPQGVTDINEYAFTGCTGLTSLTWNALECWFNGNMTTGNLSQVTIGNNVVVVPEGFAAGSGITSVTFPASVKHIGASAFSGCNGLTSLNLPIGLETIDAYAFNYCSNIHQLTIPVNVEAIGDWAFDGCDGITQLTWNARDCFSNGYMSTQNITQVTIGDEVRSIPHRFASGSKITSIVIPNSVDTIGSEAFYDCSFATSLSIGSSLASIGESAFYGCSGLTSITVDNGNITYDSRNQCNAIVEKETGTLIMGCMNTVIPSTVTAIGSDAFSGCTGLKTIDIPESVTSIGYGAFSYCTGLTDVIIGSSVEYIAGEAFYYCSSLASVTCYALTPPGINYYTFYGVPSSMIVYVPAVALEAYKSDYYWNRYTIMPFRSTANLTVNLPAGVDVERYANMRLAITNLTDGTTMHYIVSNKPSYTFMGLNYNTNWQVTLTNQYGDEFGKIEVVQVGENDVTVTFPSLLKPQDVVMTVIDPNGNDVTDKSTISWLDENGNLLKQGKQITGMPVGKHMMYKVQLPGDLAALFGVPANTDFVVQDGDNCFTLICQLNVITSTKVTGKVIDEDTGKPISGATVSATQFFAGGNTKTLTATTNNNGEYSLSARKVPTTITFAAKGYISETLDYALQDMNGSSIALPDALLKPITGAVIDLHLTYTPAHLENQPVQTQEGYSDYANVDYEIYNKRTGKAITDFNVQYPQIVLMEPVSNGDVLEITAKSRRDAFKPVKTTVTIVDQKATASLNIVQYGGVAASYIKNNNNAAVTGMLYDANGQLVMTDVYNRSSLNINELPDGNYTLVTMGESTLFNTMSRLSEYSRVGLEAGVDYVINHVAVTTGIIKSVVINEVPFLDESKFIIGDESSFTVNKSNIVIGNFLKFSVNIDFKKEYADKVNDIMLIIDLPDGCQFNENTVKVGYYTAGYSVYGNQVMIPLASNYTEVISFCATPVTAGEYAPGAYVQFSLNGKTFTQPIGTAFFSADALSLNVPSLTSDTSIPVSGNAFNGKTARVYDGDVLIGLTNCLANGTWNTKVDLYNTTDNSRHKIHAEVETKDGYTLLTEVKDVIYWKDAPLLSEIDMINNGQKIVFDYETLKTSPGSYSFNPSITSFTFVAKIKSGTTGNVHNLYFKILDNRGHITTIPGWYNASSGGWVRSANFSQNSGLPINVTVVYEYDWGGERHNFETGFSVYYQPCPSVEPLIDPSGFVYEAVPSNRLEGVTATCYYRDENDNVVLWDAEQYGQQNPLLTDENGFYRWDVPVGEWQVKYEKEGYETTYSDWLPVPPPQLDVNIGMVQMRQPEVIKAHAYTSSVEFEFDKYMMPEDLTTQNIRVTNQWNENVNGKIELLNSEVDDPNAITSLRRSPGTGMTFASKVRFTANYPFYCSEVTLHVNKCVRSYAGIEMYEDYVVTLPVEYKIDMIDAEPVLEVRCGGTQQMTVTVEPGYASEGKTLTVRSTSPMIAATDAETYTLDDYGQAVITVHGELPGMTSLVFGIDGYDLTATTLVNVEFVEDVLPGDVNGDSEVNIADVNALIDVILSGRTDDMTADVNGDGEVNIADVNALIDIILNPGNHTMLKVNSDDQLHLNDLTMKPGEVRTLNVTVDNAERFSAMQCDVVLPDGLTLLDVSAASGNEGINEMLDDHSSRVVTYSPAKRPFASAAQPVLTLTVRADGDLAACSEITLTNVVMADANNKAWRLADATARVNNSSGVNDLTAGNDRVWVEGRTLCIDARHDGATQVVTINGMVHKLNVKAGINRHVLEPGIYVIVLNGKSHKIAIK